jgi:hypothetical protein
LPAAEITGPRCAALDDTGTFVVNPGTRASPPRGGNRTLQACGLDPSFAERSPRRTTRPISKR